MQEWFGPYPFAAGYTAVVSDDELERRRALWRAPAQSVQRGFTRLYQDHVTQANEGCDFDFLEGTAATPEPDIF